MASISRIPALELSLPTVRPVVPVDDYVARLAAARSAIRARGLDVLVVFGDREQSGDLHFLTGVDPRFEEAILLLDSDGGRAIVLGNENQAVGPDVSLGITQVLFQELSPQGQFRNQPIQLAQILASFGIGAGTQVGVAGGKTLSAGYIADPSTSFSVPSYLVDALRELAGYSSVRNAVDIFLDPADGLRTAVTVHQLAECEYAGTVVSASVNKVVRSLAPGVVAWQAADSLFTYGLERSVHDMVNFGIKTARGLSSPSDQVAQLGDAYQVAQGIRGGLTCRSGAIAFDENDLAPEIREYYPTLISAYFDSLVAWYEALSLDTTAGAVYAAADAARVESLFTFALNPGHLLDFEEWSASPFVPGDTTQLRSGMVLQGDIIPSGTGPHAGVNIEDGLALADKVLRETFATAYPEAWGRVQARRAYVTDTLGVHLDESVLLFSNTPLWQPPFSLDPTRALTK